MPMTTAAALRILAAAAALAIPPGAALAHHPMGGAAPATAWEGLLSGVAHPVIGLDHLAFVIAAGLLAAGVASRGGRIALPLLFLGTGAAGTLLHLAGIGLGPVEALVAASLLGAGGLLLAKRTAPPPLGALAALFAAAGLFHGHAFAEAVVGSQAGPVLAYLIGLAAIQAAIAFGAMGLARQFSRARVPLRRWAGAAACAVGAVAGLLALAG
jgi:urease accessory protein